MPLKKTPKSAFSGTGRHHSVIVGMVIGIILAAFIAAFSLADSDNKAHAPSSPQPAGECLVINSPANGDCDFRLEKADTNEQRIRGLSGRESLAEKEGMLFEFPAPSQECIWMKDMKFSIDIIWLNEEKEIIKIEEDVSPATYPESFCAKDTKYVIELDSGEAGKAALATGQKLSF